MHADLDHEHDRLIQVDIDGNPCRIPDARGIAATARTLDSWKRPVHPTEAHLFGLDRCLTGLHERRPSSGYNRVSPALIPHTHRPHRPTLAASNVNSAVSPFRLMPNARSASVNGHFDVQRRRADGRGDWAGNDTYWLWVRVMTSRLDGGAVVSWRTVRP